MRYDNSTIIKVFYEILLYFVAPILLYYTSFIFCFLNFVFYNVSCQHTSFKSCNDVRVLYGVSIFLSDIFSSCNDADIQVFLYM